MRALTAAQGPARLSGRGSFRPSFRLGQNAEEPQSEEAGREIEAAVSALAVEIRLRTDRLVSELEISQNPELKNGISLVGVDLSSRELAGQVSLVAQALSELVDDIMTGPLESYTSTAAETSLSESKAILTALDRQATSIGAPLEEGHEGLAEEHLLSYVEDLRDLRDAAERMVVATEQAPPVMEPGEKTIMDASGILWTIGALSAGAILLAVFAGE